MITTTDLTYRYAGRKADVFHGLTLSLPAGGIYGLLGKNGEGKTTLLYLLAGLLRPTQGTCSMGGHESKKRHAEMLADLFIVGEDFQLPSVRLSHYVSALRPFYPAFSDEVLAQCLDDFHIEHNPALGALSMGQKKKVYISLALATGTRYLLMDEPTNGLDIPSKEEFRRVISHAMTPERTLIISTHQVHDVEVLLDHLIVLGNGHILLNASTEEVTQQYTFETRPVGSDLSDALLSIPTLSGIAVMAPRGERAETPLNLELLFNYLTTASSTTKF